MYIYVYMYICYMYTKRAHTCPKRIINRGSGSRLQFGDRDFRFFCKGHHLCSKLIFEHSWLLTLMEEAGSISPYL